MSRQLSQYEIESVVQTGREQKGASHPARFDFRRPDRIPKSQLRAIHLLHETFARGLVSSLSAYLRSYVTVNLVSVEQLSFAEFLEGLPSPSSMVSLGLNPYEGDGLMEVNPSLVFPIIEMLLGGTGKTSGSIKRDVTEIEQKVLDGLFRIVLQDLREAWKPVTNVDFTAQPIQNEPQLLRLMAPNEAIIAVAFEIRFGETVGMMNIAMPSIVIKMMREKFNQQWSRKTLAGTVEQTRMLRMLRRAALSLDARLEGPTLKVRDMVALRKGDLLRFDYPVDRPLELRVNGTRRFTAQVVSTGGRRACLIQNVRLTAAQGIISDDDGASDSWAA